MDISPKKRTIIVIVAFIGAYLLDLFWLSKNIKFLSGIIRLKFEFYAPGIKNITIPAFGLITVLFITLCIYTLTIIPYKRIKDKYEWKSVKDKIVGTLYGLLWIPACMVIGALLFLLVEKIFPTAMTRVAEAIGLTMSFYFFNGENSLITLAGSFASVLGLIVGLYVFSKKI